MRISMARWASAAAIGLAIAVSNPGAGHAQSVMKVCADQYKQAQANGTTNGEAWPQFLQHCKTQQSVAATPAPAPAPAAAPAPAPRPRRQPRQRPAPAFTSNVRPIGRRPRPTERRKAKAGRTILRDARRGANRRPPSRGPGGCRRRRPPRPRPPLPRQSPPRPPRAPASSPPKRRRKPVARSTSSSGSIRSPAFTTTQDRIATRTRSTAPTCARRTPKRRAIARRLTRSGRPLSARPRVCYGHTAAVGARLDVRLLTTQR